MYSPMDQQATHTFAAFTAFATAAGVAATTARAAAAAIRPAADGRRRGLQLLLLLLLVPQAALTLPNRQPLFMNTIEPGDITARRGAAAAESAVAEPAGATVAVEHKQHEVSYATQDLPVHSHFSSHAHLAAEISAVPQAGGETQEETAEKQEQSSESGGEAQEETAEKQEQSSESGGEAQEETAKGQPGGETQEETAEEQSGEEAQEETAEEQEKSSKAVALSSDKSVSAVETISQGSLDVSNSDKMYICRYGQRGLACGWRAGSNYPAGYNCMSDECCSKTKCVYGHCGAFCDSSWFLCSSSWIYIKEYSYGQCDCKVKGSQCPPNSTCHHEHKEYGGAYCTCDSGYIMSNKKCIKNPCTEVDCSPGNCTLKGLNPYCECPNGYFRTGEGATVACTMKDICKENPCGKSHEVLDCKALTPDEYTCTCAKGYVVRKASGKPKCVTYESTIRCSDLPCGTDGLDKCEDTEDGFKCICKSGYRLVDSNYGRKCEFVNPCASNICGPPAAVLSCTADNHSYTCQCQTGYSLFTGNNSQFCQIDENTGEYNNYVLAGLGAGALVVAGICYVGWSNKNKLVRGDSLGEAYEENPNVGGMSGFAGNNQGQRDMAAARSGWA